MEDRGPFAGRCYLCGEACGRTYCNEHIWAAEHLRLPLRDDDFRPAAVAVPDPGKSEDTAGLRAELGAANEMIVQLERRITAWKSLAVKQRAAA